MMKKALAVLSLCVLALVPAAAEPRSVKVRGIADFNRGAVLIVDGQLLHVGPKTVFQGRYAHDAASVRPGYDVDADGYWRTDGGIDVTRISANPHVRSSTERALEQHDAAVESRWLADIDVGAQRGTSGTTHRPSPPTGRRGNRSTPANAGPVFGETDAGTAGLRGVAAAPQFAPVAPGSPDAQRLTRIVARVVPSYMADRVTARVVQNREWNASASTSGTVAVTTGLLSAFDDDEVAIIVGHELAHVTNEHPRKLLESNRRKAALRDALAQISDETARDGHRTAAALALGGQAGVLFWQQAYSREMEEQADRIGLRYAFESGFRVAKAPEMMRKFEDRYGDNGGWLRDHPRNSDRAEKLRREIAQKFSSSPPLVVAQQAPEPKAATSENLSRAGAGTRGPATSGATTTFVSPKPEQGARPVTVSIEVGMTAAAVVTALGQPQKRVSFKKGGVTQEQWVYPELKVMLANGRVTDVRFF